MKIYVLRHELRTESPLFFTSLTQEGLNNSEKLKNVLNEIDFDVVYTSPFLRTIQTILPYCKQFNKKLSIEYSLYECTNDKRFNKDNYHYSYIDLKKQLPNIDNYVNPVYYPLIDKIVFPETVNTYKKRLFDFSEFVINKYQNTNKKILFVTHMSPVIDYLRTYKKEFHTFYKEGKVSLLYDSAVN